MTALTPSQRVFLFLQGPHGPFFKDLGKMLTLAGCAVWRVGFNAGDRAFWPDRARFIPFYEPQDAWHETCADLMLSKGVTDIVLYGDTRPIHAQAIRVAKAHGITVHVFEEGYMRPWWVTYERNGSNGYSRLMQTSIAQMNTALNGVHTEPPLPPDHWGDMRHHIFYGALYHWFVMFLNGKFRNFRPHRDLAVTEEFKLYVKRLVLMPFLSLQRMVATARIRRGSHPFHLALLQLEHDSSFQVHSSFGEMRDFLEVVIKGFADGAPKHHHLVFKAHPLDDGRATLKRDLRDLIKAHDLHGRVHLLRGGKLARLLQDCRTAVTVNSTAAQQVLWRGIPLKAFGRAVYGKSELVSDQALPAFFRNAKRPNARAYRIYRRYLLETSQVPGGFYSARGRRQLMRHVVDMMVSPDDPYDALTTGTASQRQQLRVVK
ncbi:MAG: capsule biosynthesis protein [Paracoccaceae bacterium]